MVAHLAHYRIPAGTRPAPDPRSSRARTDGLLDILGPGRIESPARRALSRIYSADSPLLLRAGSIPRTRSHMVFWRVS